MTEKIVLQKSSIIVKSFGADGKAFVEDGILKVRYPGASFTDYTVEDAQKMGLELVDATRKDIKALRKAGFVLMLRKGEEIEP